MEYWVSKPNDVLILISDEEHRDNIRFRSANPSIPTFHYSNTHAFDYNKAADLEPGPEGQVLNVRTKSRVV